MKQKSLAAELNQVTLRLTKFTKSTNTLKIKQTNEGDAACIRDSDERITLAAALKVKLEGMLQASNAPTPEEVTSVVEEKTQAIRELASDEALLMQRLKRLMLAAPKATAKAAAAAS